MSRQDKSIEHLPACVVEYINHVIRRMRYSRSARREVRQELIDHFTDALADYPDPDDRQKAAEELIAEFGEAKLLATLIRRGKKRNRPAWEKALIRTFQGLLVLIGVFILYAAWFFTGRPAITTNYITVLNEKMQPKAPESENAWPYYRQVILHYMAPPAHVTPPTTQPADPRPVHNRCFHETDVDIAHAPDFIRDAIRKYIADNEDAWQEYVAAGRKPYCWYDTNTMEGLHQEIRQADAARKGQPMPPPTATMLQPEELVWKDSAMASLLPPLSMFRSLAKIGVFKAHLAEAEGKMGEAMEDALAIVRAARHWQNPNGYIISQLVGIATSNLAVDEIRRLAGQKGLTSADLQRAQEQLTALYPDGYPLLGVEAERIGFVDTLQRLFTDGGPGGGHLIPRQARYVTRFYVGSSSYEEPSLLMFAASFLQAGRDETLSMGDAHFNRTAEWSRLTPYQRQGKMGPGQMLVKTNAESFRYRFVRMFFADFSRASELVWQARCEYEATMAVLALQRYHLDKGEYPVSLEALVEAGYLPQVPADPYSSGSLVYRRTGDAFTLYSIGGDFKDDGGVENLDDPWSALGSNKPGDRVFWPVRPLRPFSVEEEPVQGALAG